MKEVDIISNIAESKLTFMLNTSLWNSFDLDVLRIISAPHSWNEVKLLGPDGKRNSLLTTIPKDKGGVYLFLVKPGFLLESHSYLMYVGRAHITENHNLRKRCLQYITEKKRPKVKRMIEQWGEYLYVKYLPLDDNEMIDLVEEELINKILPPCNDKIPNKKISAAVKAFTV